jgi:hypothetical protein
MVSAVVERPAPTMKLSDAAAAHVERELFAFNDTVRELQRLTADVATSGSEDRGEVSPLSRAGTPIWNDPTFWRACALHSHRRIEELTRIARGISRVRARMEPPALQLVTLLYDQRKSMPEVALALDVHVKTAYRMRGAIVAEVAAELGWS